MFKEENDGWVPAELEKSRKFAWTTKGLVTIEASKLLQKVLKEPKREGRRRQQPTKTKKKGTNLCYM